MTIQELKEDVTIEEVLAFYGGSLGRRSYGQQWAPMTCPFCADSSGSASVNVVAGRFLCHQCGAPRDGKSGDIVDIVKYQEGFTETRQAIEWIERTFR